MTDVSSIGEQLSCTLSPNLFDTARPRRREMSNVIILQARRTHDHPPGVPPQLGNEISEIAELASRVVLLQTKAKEEMHRAIVLLELTSQKVKLIADRIVDPLSKRGIEEQIDAIEELLKIVRERMLTL